MEIIYSLPIVMDINIYKKSNSNRYTVRFCSQLLILYHKEANEILSSGMTKERVVLVREQDSLLHCILAENERPAHWAEKWMMGEVGLGIFPFGHFVSSGPHSHTFYLGINLYMSRKEGSTRLHQ